MSKREYFSKALQKSYTPEERAALERWNAARAEHKAESALYYRARTSLPPKNEWEAFHIALHEVARLRYSKACKKLEEERSIFTGAFKPVLQRSRVDEAIDAFIAVLKGLEPNAIVVGKAAQQHQANVSLYGEASPENPLLAPILQAIQDRKVARANSLEQEEATTKAYNPLLLTDEIVLEDPALPEE